MNRDRLAFWLKVSTVPVTVGLWYLVYKAYRSDPDDDWERSRYFDSSGRSEYCVASVRVPKRAVGALIGRGGGTVRRLQETTRARITFAKRDADQEEEELVIRGVAKNVAEAERQVRAIIAAVPETLVEETRLASRFIGPLIGRNGDNIRALMNSTGAKIDVERTTGNGRKGDLNEERNISIRGTREQIDAVLARVDELRAELEEKERRKEELTGSVQPLPDEEAPLEVMVSAVKRPDVLFLQLVRSVFALVPLVEQLTDHFSARRHNPSLSFKPGDVVAAVYQDAWHRARVAGESEHGIDVDYLDYGDAADVPAEKVQPLTEPAFLKLPFQAIEVRLHGVACDKEREEEAMNLLEEVTYQAHGRPLLAKVVARDGALPLVRLFDPSRPGEENVDINEALIQSGLYFRPTSDC